MEEQAPPVDPLATPAGRAAVAQSLVQGLNHLEDIFGLAFPSPDPGLLARRGTAADCANPDRFHAAALSGLFPDFALDRDGFAGLAARIAAHVPASPVLAQALAGAAARFGRPEAALLDEARARLAIAPTSSGPASPATASPGPTRFDAAGSGSPGAPSTGAAPSGSGPLGTLPTGIHPTGSGLFAAPPSDPAADPLHWASAPGHVHAKVNHGLWEDITHMGLAAAGDAGRLAAFRGHRRAYLEEVLPQILTCRDCRFFELFEAGLRRFALEGGEAVRSAFLGPGHSLGVSVVNGDVPWAEALRPPLHLVARGALPGLLALLEAVFPQAQGHALRLADGGSMRQLVWQGRLDAFMAAATEGAEAVVFVVPGHLRRLALRRTDLPQHHILIPAIHAHEFWPVVMASVLGQAAALMRRHDRLTVFVQAAVMSLPLIAGLRALARRRPGLRLRCFDMGQVLDTADPARLGSGQLTMRTELAAVVAAQPMPLRFLPPDRG